MTESKRAYLDTPVRSKFPVGKIDAPVRAKEVMHKLVERDGKWYLACAPSKLGIYSYRGFISVVTCARCKQRDPSQSKGRDTLDIRDAS